MNWQQQKATDAQIRFWGHAVDCLMWRDRVNCDCGVAGPKKSQFEIAARAEKVARIVTLVPRKFTASKAKAAKVADRMAAFTAEQRDRWAVAAGAHPASDETWAMVVAAVRVRYPRVHRHDFRDGDVCSTCDAVKRLEVI